MEADVRKKIELLANIAIIVVACLLATVIVKNYLLTTFPDQTETTINNNGRPKEQESINISEQLSRVDIKIPAQSQLLLLAISSDCHFCTESAGFYRRLAQKKDKTRLVALMPQPINESQEYLEKLGVCVDEIRQLPLSDIGVLGTPTLLLLDRSGVVKQKWIGKLSPEREQFVLSAL